MVTVPSMFSSLNRKSCFVRSASATISCARRFSSIPSSVRIILWLLRVKSFTPSSASKSAICRDSVGCVTCSCSAARVKFSSLATVRK